MRRRDPFEEALLETVARHALVAGCERVLLAVSGGQDSMALLYAWVRLAEREGWPAATVAHFDHRLRGEQSRSDAEFVASEARRVGLECLVGSADVAGVARASGRNLEAVARDLRYEFLASAAREAEADRVATAHTASDQAETVLMRLARGTGVDGLAGIAPARPLGASGATLIRPLLGATRAEAADYCARTDVPFRSDPTNEDTDLSRAFTRAEIVPRLERFAPGAAANLARTASLAADDRAYFAEVVEGLLAGWGVQRSAPTVELPAAEVAALPPALRRRVLREAVRRARGDLKRLTAEHVDSIDRLLGPGRDGREASLPAGVRARRAGAALLVEATIGAPRT